MSNLSGGSRYSSTVPQATGGILTRTDFLEHVQAVSSDIDEIKSLTTQLNQLHRSAIDSTSSSSAQIDQVESRIQSKNRGTRDAIKYLQGDAASTHGADSALKKAQADKLKRDFEAALREYQQEQSSYIRNYRERIRRDYRVVNPTATEEEVNQAAEMDWGNEGVFQTAV
jgi:syntaxin 1B/2/3